MELDVRSWLLRARNAELEANRVLASVGHSRARVVFLADVKAKLSGAPIDVQEYFDEAITCLQHELTRSAIVVSWSGFFALFCEALFADKETEIRAHRTKWAFTDSAELKENYPEAQLIDLAKDVGFIRNSKRRMLDGWLWQRNQCAHPTVYRPTPDIAIGYVASMIDETVALL